MASRHETVKTLIGNQFGFHADNLSDDMSFLNDLGADSLDTVELAMELEDEFDIIIPDDVVYTLHTVGDVLTYVDSRF